MDNPRYNPDLASSNDLLDELAAQLDDRLPTVPVFFIYEKDERTEIPLVLIDVGFEEDKIIVRLAE